MLGLYLCHAVGTLAVGPYQNWSCAVVGQHVRAPVWVSGLLFSTSLTSLCYKRPSWQQHEQHTVATEMINVFFQNAIKTVTVTVNILPKTLTIST
eukprot:2374346-Amphidinium_carterae.1